MRVRVNDPYQKLEGRVFQQYTNSLGILMYHVDVGGWYTWYEASDCEVIDE